jgi:hypothetical protein
LHGLLKFASAFDPAGNAYKAAAPEQDGAIAALQQIHAQRRADELYCIGPNILKEGCGMPLAMHARMTAHMRDSLEEIILHYAGGPLVFITLRHTKDSGTPLS